MSEAQDREAQKPSDEVRLSSVVVVPALIFSVTFAILAGVLGPMLIAEQRNARILRDGVAAKARVMSIVPTGGHHNEDPEVVISLEVMPNEGEPFASTVETSISPVYLPRFQPGLTVEVRFDPNRPHDVALVTP